MTQVPVLQTDLDTFLHRRDPRVKVLLFVGLIAFIYVAPTWRWTAGLTALGLVMAAVARVSWKWLAVLSLLQLPNVLGLVLIPAGRGLWEGNLAMTDELAFGLRLGFAWLAAIFIGVSLVASMQVDELTAGLRGVGLPESACFVVGYTFLLLYLSGNDILRIADAMKVKGVPLETRNPFRLLAGLPRLMLPAIFTVIRRATTMIAVLDMRGYAFLQGRARRAELKFDLADAATLACGLLIVGGAAARQTGVV